MNWNKGYTVPEWLSTLLLVGMFLGWPIYLGVSSAWEYCDEHYFHKITGLGEIKLGDHCETKQGSTKANFLSFDRLGWRAMTKSSRCYVVYYYKYIRDFQGFNLTDRDAHTEDIKKIHRDIDTIKNVWSSKYSTQKLIDKEASVDIDINELTGFEEEESVLFKKWRRIFLVKEKYHNRELAIYVAGNDSLGVVVVVAIDWDMYNRETKERLNDCL